MRRSEAYGRVPPYTVGPADRRKCVWVMRKIRDSSSAIVEDEVKRRPPQHRLPHLLLLNRHRLSHIMLTRMGMPGICRSTFRPS